MRSFAHFSGRSAKCQFVREHNHFLPALITPGRTHSHATNDFGCILHSMANAAYSEFIQNTEAELEGADIAKTKRKWRAISIIRQSETPQVNSFGFGSKEEERWTEETPARCSQGRATSESVICGRIHTFPAIHWCFRVSPAANHLVCNLEMRFSSKYKCNYSLITVFIISSYCTTLN